MWVAGALLAGSARQTAVLVALAPLVGPDAAHPLRQRWREWPLAGAVKAAPGIAAVDVAARFAALPRWVLAWWRGPERARALDLDATS